ncbi:MAG: hypothetical protein DRQ02_12485, partial [Candidatus Latescibacterota bacterium]
MERVDDVDWRVRQAAVSSLGEIAKANPEFTSSIIPKLMEKVIKWLDDVDWRVRQAAVSSLGEIARVYPEFTSSIIPKLMERLDDVNWRVRQAAVSSLGEIARVYPEFTSSIIPKLVEKVIKWLDDVNWYVRQAAVSSLAEIVRTIKIDENYDFGPILKIYAWLKKKGINYGYMNQADEIELHPFASKDLIFSIQNLVRIVQENGGRSRSWYPTYYGLNLYNDFPRHEILPVVYVKPKRIDGVLVPGTGIFYTDLSPGWPPTEFHLRTEKGLETIKMEENDYVPMFGYRTSGRGFVVPFNNGKMVCCKGETMQHMDIFEDEGRIRQMPKRMQNYNLAQREAALLKLFGTFDAQVRELDSYYFNKEDPAYPIVMKESDGRLAQLQIWSDGPNFFAYRWAEDGMPFQMRRVKEKIWRELGFESEYEFIKFRIRSLFQNLGKLHMLHLYNVGLDGENISILGDLVDLEYTELREGVFDLAKNISNALQFVVLRHGEHILIEETRDVEKYLIGRSLVDIFSTQMPYLEMEQIVELAKIAILEYLPPLKDYKTNSEHRELLERLIGHGEVIFSFSIEGQDEVKIAQNSLANLVVHHILKPGDKVPGTKEEAVCETALGIAFDFNELREDLSHTYPDTWEKYKKSIEAVYGKRISYNKKLLGGRLDGGANLNISSLKQIASFLREGRLSKGNIQPKVDLPLAKWYEEIATDKGNSRLGFILDVSGSDLKEYLFEIKPYLEDKKAFIFVGMGGSINTVKIMRKFSQDRKIIFIDTPDKIM